MADAASPQSDHERGVEVDHVTVYRWVQRFTPLLADAAQFARHSPRSQLLQSPPDCQHVVVSDPTFEQRMVLRWAKVVSRVLEITSLTSVGVIAARVFNGDKTIEAWGIKNIPLNATWAVMVALTIVHAFGTIFLYEAICGLRVRGSAEEQTKTYQDLQVGAGHYLGIMVRRIPAPGRRLAKMSPADASTWVAYGGASAAALATLPWWWDDGLKWPGWRQSLLLAAAVLGLGIANWLIGSKWAIAISRLGQPGAPPLRLEVLSWTAPFYVLF
jgi:hypothetical protein